MKKTILLFGLFILSLPLLFTSCNDDDYEEVIIPDNVITLGNAISSITSVYSKTENDDTFIIVNTNAMQLILEFDNKPSIPTGNMPLTLNGDYSGEIMMIWSGVEYLLTGDLSISSSGDVYTIAASGNAALDYYTFVPFNLYYKGKVTATN